MISPLSSLVLLLSASTAVAPADTLTSGPTRMDDLTYDGAAGELRVPTPVVVDPDMEVDGILDEAAWEQAAVLQGFTQFEPAEGVAASQRTETLVFVTADAIYFGVRAWDSDPGGIRATLSERDGFTRSDDYVRFVLDTFDDQRRAYVLTVNPYGVQHDGLWVEGGSSRGMGPPIDDNPDFLWASDAKIQPWGWSAEVRVPFKSLRFPERPVQAWGINVLRKIQRSGYEESWAPISGDIANKLAQSGRLSGLENLDPGLFLELNPVLTGKRIGAWDEGTGGLVHDDVEGEFGMNLTYGLTSNLTLDGTFNPDFSQVEADAGQIAVNERFALFFPEKRPFFLEGTEVFSLPAQLIYTRSIVNPIAGAKVTGKLGGLNLGYLGAVDESFGEGSDAVVNLLRLRQDVGSSSTFGGLYTDRTHSGDHYNRVAGVDGRLILASRYTLSLLGAASWTAEGDGSGPETGRFLMAKFERAGRAFSFEGEFEDVGPDFRAGSGFIRRVGDTRAKVVTRYNWYGDSGAFFEQWGPFIELEGFWDHDRFWEGSSLEEGQMRLGGRMSLRNNITVFGTFNRARFDYPAAAYDGLYVLDSHDRPRAFHPDMGHFDAMNGARIFAWLNSWERVRGNVRLSWNEVPIFDRGFGVPVEPGESWNAEVSVDLFPTPRLRGEVGLRHETISRQDGTRYSTATIPRIRAQYQFTRAFFVRTIVEYASQERGALQEPGSGRPLYACDAACEPREGSEGHDFHVEGLVSYEPSPGTVVFLGYTRAMIDDDRFAFSAIEPRADGLFAKVSYRFRF